MTIITKAINFIFRLLFSPFEKLTPLLGLIIISLFTGILILIVFRFTSNQKAIKRAKDKIKAYIYELFLYKDNIRVILKALLSILKYNSVYLKQTLKPLMIVIIPIILILIQLQLRYGLRPLKPNESVIVKLKLNRHLTADDIKVQLNVPDAIIIETPVLKIENQSEFDWRLKVDDYGKYELLFLIGEKKIIKSIQVSKQIVMISPIRVYPSFIKTFSNPSENPLAKNSAVESIEVKYPNRNIKIVSWHVHWLIIFFVFSMISAFALKGVLRVEI